MRAEFPIRVAAFSPDGKLLALGTEQGTIEIWDLAARRRLRSWTAHRGDVQSLVFHPDGDQIASEGSDRRIVLWSAADGKEIWAASHPRGSEPLAEPEFANTRIAFAEGGERLAAFGFFWETASGNHLDRYGPSGPVSVRAGWIASPSGKGFRLRDLKTLSEEWDKKENALQRLEVSPDGKMLAVGRAAFGAGASLYRLPDGTHIGVGFLDEYWISGVAFSPDSRHLALSGYMDAVYVYDTQTMAEELRLDTPGVKNYWVGFSPDGKTLAAVGENEEVRLWSFPAGKPLSKK